jgi:hypothetical protein
MPTGVGGERCVVSGCGYSRRAAGRVQTAEGVFKRAVLLCTVDMEYHKG